jgi:hypothetical protein
MSLTRSLLMHAVVRYLFPGLLLCAMSAAQAMPPTALTVNDSGDAGNGSCTSACTLRDAISNIAFGGTIDFAPPLLPATITLTQGQLTISKSMRIQGPGATQLSISANGSSRVLSIGGSIDVDIVGSTLRDGTVVGADGVSGAAGSGGTGTAGNGTFAGCINLSTGASLILDHVEVRSCLALGGNGGNGGSGVPSSGAGGPGGDGGYAAAGCISVFDSSLVLDRTDIRDCVAQAGAPGTGGSGAAGSGLAAGGRGGDGGNGYFAEGGGIDVSGDSNVTLRDSSLTNCKALGAAGGDGGAGGSGFFDGPGGNGGNAPNGSGHTDFAYASGGAIYFQGTNLSVYNSTIAGGAALAGRGGNGGTGDTTYSLSPGGAGGNGGGAKGGLIDVESGVADLQFATLANGESTAGAGGAGGAGSVGGAAGVAGSTNGTAISVGLATGTALSSVIVGPAGGSGLCAINFAGGHFNAVQNSANLDQDSSCSGFTLHGSLAQVFRPFDADALRPAYMPVYHSAVIGAAPTCNDASSQVVTTDQQDTPRPQGSACDLGAIEADYIFVDGLD